MARDRRPAEELAIEELEALLARKKLEARDARLRQFKRSGRALRLRQEPGPISQINDFHAVSDTQENASPDESPTKQSGVLRSVFNRLLLLIEIGAVFGLAFILFMSIGLWKVMLLLLICWITLKSARNPTKQL